MQQMDKRGQLEMVYSLGYLESEQCTSSYRIYTIVDHLQNSGEKPAAFYQIDLIPFVNASCLGFNPPFGPSRELASFTAAREMPPMLQMNQQQP